MATKILITPKNSIWGVIVNPQSSNTYRHALSFDTPALKKAFIDKELCEDKDYKALLAAQKETSFTRMTPTSGVFTIHPEQYPDETFFTLLNKDFCIIEEDGIEQFFTLTGTRDPDGGNTIVFTAELDIFFTYDIKDGMFNDQETEINRSMFDRYIKSGNKIIPRNNYQDTPLVNKESFDSDFSDLLFPTSTTKDIVPTSNISWDWSKIIEITPMADTEKQFFEQQFLKLKWSIVTMVSDKTFAKVSPNKFIQTDNGNEVNTVALSSKNQNQPIHFPYVNFISLVASNEAVFPKFTERSPNGNLYGWNLSTGELEADNYFSSFEKAFLEDPTILKDSLQVLATSPLVMLDNVVLTPHGVYNPLFGSDFRIQISDPARGNNWEIFTTPSTNSKNIPMALIGIKNIKLNESETDLNIKIHNDNIILDPSKQKDILLEPKLEMSPYRMFQFGSSTKTKSLIKPELFTKNELKIIINNSYLTTTWGYQIDIKNYGNINNQNIEFIPSSRNYIVEDFANYGIPTNKVQWEEFMIRNRASQNAGFLNKGIGLGLGVLGAITSPVGGLGVLGLASVAANSAAGINSQIAQRKDIKNSPNEIQNNGSTFEFDFITKSITPYIQELKLEPIILKQIWDHIYKYGYSVNGEIKNINSILKTRYWFNYVEASKTYENIALQASDQIKQLINDTLENGLTIWHIRDLNTFKGIKNYENENVEMSFITTVNDEEVINDNREEE